MYSLSEKVERLKQCPLFETLSNEELKVISLTSSEVICKAGEVLFRQGDEAFEAYVVFEGEAEAYIDLDDGRVLIFSTFQKSDIFGEFAILGNVARTANVRITKDFTGLKISKDVFFQTIREFPEISLRIMNILIQRLLKTQQKYVDLVNGTRKVDSE